MKGKTMDNFRKLCECYFQMYSDDYVISSQNITDYKILLSLSYL